jgi:hypothetical protein
MNVRKFYVNAFGLQNPTLLDELVKNSVCKKVEKDTVFAQRGDIQQEVPFLMFGGFQGSFSTEKGKEVIDCISVDLGDPIIGSVHFGEPSPITITALFKSKVVCVPIQVVQKLMNEYAEWNDLYKKLSNTAIERHRQVQQMLHQDDATRYKWFLDVYGEKNITFKQKTIASFLGISETWLSRIIKEMNK